VARSSCRLERSVTERCRGVSYKNPGYKVVITGQSLSGALAKFAAVQAATAGIASKLYTYNKPETGNLEYAEYVEKKA
jgi:hypothetical protein